MDFFYFLHWTMVQLLFEWITGCKPLVKQGTLNRGALGCESYSKPHDSVFVPTILWGAPAGSIVSVFTLHLYSYVSQKIVYMRFTFPNDDNSTKRNMWITWSLFLFEIRMYASLHRFISELFLWLSLNCLPALRKRIIKMADLLLTLIVHDRQVKERSFMCV